jgi:cell division protein FtsI (penicillin-binding protein 3)
LSPSQKPSAAPGKGSTHRSAPSASGRRPKLHRSTRRLVSLFVVFTFAFLAMAARLVTLQIVDAPAYARLAVEQREREVAFPARRGAILDRNGNPLAISVDLHTVFVDPAHVENIELAARKLAPVLLQTVGSLREKLDGAVPGDRFEYLARQVPPRVAKRVKKLRIPGIYLQVEPKRFYPGGRLASHVLGFAGIDGAGLEGIEKQYDSILQGRPGRMVLEQDPEGRALPQAEYSYERPVPGQSLLLSLDKQLQYFTELTLAEAARRYDAEAASAIVMRPRTGEILALANVPDYDPNEAGRYDTLERRNRALTDVYEPGSVYKIVAVAAALEEKVVSPKTTFTVPDSFAYSDRVFHDSHPHPTERMTVADIIGDSSNVGTIQIGLRLGGRKLDRYVRKFGFGSVTGLDFPGESPGIVLDRSDWTGPTIATIPIGQGIAVTPLQLIQAYSTLANRGVSVEPKLLYATLGSEGRVDPSPPPARHRVVSRSTARKMTKILRGVVEKGTGIEAQIPGYDVAGKTGTAQEPLPGGGYGNSWVGSFAGFVPASRPEIVVLVTLDNPSPIWGGSTAAPTFRTISEFALRHLGVAPTGNAEKAVKEIEEEVAAEPKTYD